MNQLKFGLNTKLSLSISLKKPDGLNQLRNTTSKHRVLRIVHMHSQNKCTIHKPRRRDEMPLYISPSIYSPSLPSHQPSQANETQSQHAPSATSSSSPSTIPTIGRRALIATSGIFLPFSRDVQSVRQLPVDRIVVAGVEMLDGQFVVLVGDEGGGIR